MIAEYEDLDSDGAADDLARKFIYGPGIDEPLIMIDVDSGVFYWYHYDGLGSVVALSKWNSGAGQAEIVEKYSYDVFGLTTIHGRGPDGTWGTGDDTTPSKSDFGNPYMFTGRHYDDETGLYYYRARMYAPPIGRFLQPDPIGYADSMNLYQYCGNNSVNRIDPEGMASKEAGNFWPTLDTWEWDEEGHLIAPTLILAGADVMAKRLVTEGVPHASTSVASIVLRKVFPWKMGTQVLGTASAGGALARAVPYIGWTWLACDALYIFYQVNVDPTMTHEEFKQYYIETYGVHYWPGSGL